ncbi:MULTISPECIES: hypothetical protein [Streptomyces]|uniref:hypothetical protein n=1 Tax=Streptomyces TaxID=1883 RepID=UPI00163C2F3D|nr:MULTISPECIES: hypothetical protein [Streptomyces]MBC2876993.1 hypothetical protein [Streptomyces sp. TYQ1024]UBI36017.1 hypothetical protein K7I03_05770 [Streptomyces mobaraensis]UKW28610.1 hypothetical protein MCU78_05760 [Streptomyces sp. TYQ1024]
MLKPATANTAMKPTDAGYDPPMRGSIVFAWRGTGAANPAAGALIRHLRGSVSTVGSAVGSAAASRA